MYAPTYIVSHILNSGHTHFVESYLYWCVLFTILIEIIK